MKIIKATDITDLGRKGDGNTETMTMERGSYFLYIMQNIKATSCPATM
jgi:hypothetical protein